MKLACSIAAVACALVSGLVARPARAFERQWHVGAAAGIAGGHGLALAPALGAYAAYGLSDVFDARLELTARGYQIGSSKNPNAVTGMVGLVYKLDVLRWVPWGGVYAGYQALLRAPRAGLTFKERDVALGLGGGLDYSFSRELGCGASARVDQGLTVSEARSFEALLRFEYRWGF
jgi:hypothetical protein